MPFFVAEYARDEGCAGAVQKVRGRQVHTSTISMDLRVTALYFHPAGVMLHMGVCVCVCSGCIVLTLAGSHSVCK